ncbi:CHAT domain-containing protein [Streptomyces sp. NBC_00005]|uniref:CHAT domain-containing tetratricopeptide repeat protein n=1 Tax=Streptomyces sp. NBC_00005 TaxID=2903609 RepID=UPI0032442A80
MRRRDELLALSGELLQRIRNSGDPSLALAPQVTALADDLAASLDESETWDLPARHVLGWVKWYQSEALPAGQRRTLVDEALEWLTPTALWMGVWELPRPLLPELADRVAPTLTGALDHAVTGSDTGLLSDVIVHWIHLVNATPEGHPDRARRLAVLCGGLCTRFLRIGEPRDLDSALATGRRAVQIASGRLDLAMSLSNLSVALKIGYERTGADADLDEAVTVARRAVLAAEGLQGQSAALTNLGALLQTRFDRKGGGEDLEEATALARRSLDVIGADDPNRAAVLNNLSTALQCGFRRTESVADLDEAVRVGRACVAAAGDHPDKGMYLSTLGRACRSRFQQTGAAADLDEAVDVMWQAVQATSARHAERASRLADLGNALESRFELAGLPADSAEAVAVLRQAVTATPERHPHRALRLLGLSTALQKRFALTRVAAVGDEAVAVARQAVEATDVVDRSGRSGLPLMLTNLGSTLLARHETTHVAADIDDAVAACRQAVAAAAEDDAHRELYLSTLDLALWRRFQLSGTPADLHETVSVRQLLVEATAADHPDRCARLWNLALVLLCRFQRTDAFGDLQSALAVEREALEAAADDAERTACLSNLCAALYIRFDRLGGREDLEEAISFGRRAVEATDHTGGDLPGALLNVAKALHSRSRLTRSVQDVDEAIGFARRAVARTERRNPDGTAATRGVARTLNALPDQAGSRVNFGGAGGAGRHSITFVTTGDDDLAGVLDLLADCLKDRFGRTRSLADAEEAVRTRRRAVEATAADHVKRAGRLAALSFALRLRFERAGEPADLDASVEAARNAVDEARTDDPKRGIYLASLSNALHFRFERTRDSADLDAAVEFGRQDVERAQADETSRVQGLSNLCSLLQTRFEVGGDPDDLDEAVDRGRRALDAAPADHRNRPEALLVTATALRSRFIRREASADRDEALGVLTELVRSEAAPPRLRIHGARFGSGLAALTDPRLAAELLETVVLLLPEIASPRMRRDDQQHAIGWAAQLADGAAAAVLADTTRPLGDRAQRALSLLEAGRAVLLSQTLDARSDLAELRRVHPALAARFADLRERLDRDVGSLPSRQAGKAAGDVPDDRIDMAAEMTALLGRIRALDGFDDFALPPALDELRSDAAQGPIVTFNIHDRHSHALLLTADGVTALPLPALTPRAVIDKVNTFHVALREATDPDADRIAAQADLTDVLAWLWDNAAGPVLDALGHRGTPPDAAVWPRVWWAPSGRLSLLPLHAAGHHGDPGSGSRHTVMDRVVSSYTPTVRALRHARQRRTATGADRSLVVAMPTTPGLPDHGLLQHVAAETESVAGLLPDPLVLIEPGADPAPDTTGPPPTHDLVLAELPRRPIVHFACHGAYDIEDPSAGRLLLHDHETRPLTVGSLVGVDLQGAQLAYLSACHTALNAADHLLDEAMHLAGAFQLAGFPQVVGTLWTVDDEVAVDIAEDFYATLRDPATGTLDLDRAAHALHRATRSQRDRYPRTPSLWAAHLYTGS